MGKRERDLTAETNKKIKEIWIQTTHVRKSELP